MSELKELIEIVSDENIGENAWSDDSLTIAVDLVDKIKDRGEIRECWNYAESLRGIPRIRLIQAITDIHFPELFDPLIEMLQSTDDDDLAEIIIDGLRCWPLDESQKERLLQASAPQKGKSELLDIIIDHIQ